MTATAALGAAASVHSLTNPGSDLWLITALLLAALSYRFFGAKVTATPEHLIYRGILRTESIDWRDVIEVRVVPGPWWVHLLTRPSSGQSIVLEMTSGRTLCPITLRTWSSWGHLDQVASYLNHSALGHADQRRATVAWSGDTGELGAYREMRHRKVQVLIALWGVVLCVATYASLLVAGAKGSNGWIPSVMLAATLAAAVTLSILYRPNHRSR